MEIYKRLPKDLKYIVNDFLKDKSNYNKCMLELENRRSTALNTILYEINVKWSLIDYDDLMWFINHNDFIKLIRKKIININSKIF